MFAAMSRLRRESRYCGECSAEKSFLLVSKMNFRAGVMYFWQCETCENTGPRLFSSGKYAGRGLNPEGWVSHAAIRVDDFIPLICDETIPHDAFEPCRVCNVRHNTNELHHWLPKAIAGLEMAEKWPKDFLCREHHIEWHQFMTPQFHGKRKIP